MGGTRSTVHPSPCSRSLSRPSILKILTDSSRWLSNVGHPLVFRFLYFVTASFRAVPILRTYVWPATRPTKGDSWSCRAVGRSSRFWYADPGFLLIPHSYIFHIVPCGQYLCPSTLTCVSNPAQCPCPDPQDIRCTIPDADGGEDATVLCVRGVHGCEEVERLAGLRTR